MKREIPTGGRAERKAFALGWIRERRSDVPSVRLTRGRRRLIVVGLYLLLLATVSALAGGPGAMPSVLGATPATYLIWLFTAQFTCFMLLNYSVRGLLLGNAYIDERERELRDRATAVAYRILTRCPGLYQPLRHRRCDVQARAAGSIDRVAAPPGADPAGLAGDEPAAVRARLDVAGPRALEFVTSRHIAHRCWLG
jgi:hypothetical protein